MFSLRTESKAVRREEDAAVRADSNSTSDEYFAVVESVAQMTPCDIAQIESRHSSNREISMMRARGWWPSLKALASIFIARTVSRMRGSDPGAEPNAESFQTKRKRQKKSRRRGGGGAWRAFVSSMLRGTRGGVPPSRFAELAEHYRALSDDQMAFYREVGEAAAKAHAAGYTAFGDLAARPEVSRASADVPAVGDVRADGVIVAPDNALSFQEIQRYEGDDSFEQRYLQQRSIVLKEMKDAARAQTAKREAQQKASMDAALKSREDDLPAQLDRAGHTSSAAACVCMGTGACVNNLACLRWNPPIAEWVKARAETIPDETLRGPRNSRG